MIHVTRRTVLVAVVLLSLAALFRVERYYGTLYHGWDAQFYYSLAHSLVFDRDVDVTNNLRLTPSPTPFDPTGDGSFSEVPRHDGRFASKYPVGLSVFQAPWLAGGHAIRVASDSVLGRASSPVGYSRVELWAVILGLVLAFAWAMATLFGWIAAEYGVRAAVVGVAACWCGTSLFYYSAVFPFMAHALSFAVLTAVMCAARRVAIGDDLGPSLIALGASSAALFLVRPQQILVTVFLAPLVVAAMARTPAQRWLPGAAIAVALGVAALGITAGENYLQFGTWGLSGYAVGDEGFDWLRPNLAFVLFSESRGLFVFSPVIVIALLGYLQPGTIPRYAWPFVANAVAQVYLIAAWSSPEQGEAFGARMWSDNAAVVAFGLAALFERHAGWKRAAVVVGVLACVAWTTYLVAQYVLS